MDHRGMYWVADKYFIMAMSQPAMGSAPTIPTEQLLTKNCIFWQLVPFVDRNLVKLTGSLDNIGKYNKNFKHSEPTYKQLGKI